ncbi:dicarboxylate transporter [Myriangium duriaei CBS 260.36]|uniref:Dicarboxylate transporter n=1 Tax=Myriangium duriaei CBS 260.36 TaxID=1168546 RepID=A0A9P4J9F5_9PEZI|nr:dicarboxylate transporter [Myriangium duriaei CBS 260.36]
MSLKEKVNGKAQQRASRKSHDSDNITYPWWFGGSASCFAVCLTHPLDLIKVRMQAAHKGPVRLGTVGTALDVVRKDSVTGLYRGLTAGLARQLIYGTTRFAIYDILKHKIHESHASHDGTSSSSSSAELLPLIAAASFSGFLAGIVGNPADLANVRMQNDSTLPAAERRNYRNVFSAWGSMAREPGGFMRNSMRGVWANSIRAAIMTSSQLACYDVFKDLLVSTGSPHLDANSSLTHFSASTLAGLVATTLCSPVDVLKTQIMKARKEDARPILELIRHNFAESGPRWMFRGWVPSFTRLGPQTIATFIILEQHRRLYRYLTGVE